MYSVYSFLICKKDERQVLVAEFFFFSISTDTLLIYVFILDHGIKAVQILSSHL